MPYLPKQFRTRPTVQCRLPTHQVGARPKQRVHQAIAIGSRMHSTAHNSPATSCTGLQRRRGRGNSCRALSVLPGDLLTILPGFRSPQRDVRSRTDTIVWRFPYFDRPDQSANRGKIGRIFDLLVSKELRPGAVRCVAQVVGQFSWRIPAAGWLRRAYPEKREAVVGVTERNHVTGEEVSARASSRA